MANYFALTRHGAGALLSLFLHAARWHMDAGRLVAAGLQNIEEFAVL